MTLQRPTLIEIESELGARRFRAFVGMCWEIMEPASPFLPNIAVDAICEHLQAVGEGTLTRLCICVPPGSAKSLLTSVAFPAWLWTRNAAERMMYNSYSSALSIRDSVRCRRLVESLWYRTRWPGVRLCSDQNEKTRYDTSATGHRIASSVGGMGTGERADLIVVDDPLNATKAESDAERDAANEWFFGTLPSRFNDYKTGRQIVIAQRLHEADVVGELLRRELGYEMLVLPMEHDGRARGTSIGWSDPRTEVGELLDPVRVPRVEVDRLFRTLGSYRYNAQYQQMPTSMQGNLFKRSWWRYDPETVGRYDFVIQSWDMAFKDLRTSDYVVGGVFGVRGADVHVLEVARERLSFTETLKAVRSMRARWPSTSAIYVEDKANGTAVLDTLKHEVPGLIAYTPEESKMARAASVTPEVEAGNVYLPTPDRAAWVDGFIEELAAFPKSAYDDQVDMFSQALIKIRERRDRLAISMPPVISLERTSAWKTMG